MASSPCQQLDVTTHSISGELARRGSKCSSLTSTNISPSLRSNSSVCILPPAQRQSDASPTFPHPHDEQLFEIFQTFATDGLVHVDQIPTILTLRDEKYTATEIDHAVHATTISLGGGGCLLPYDQVLAVWQTLSAPQCGKTPPIDSPSQQHWLLRCCSCLQSKRNHSLMLGVRSKPTNWLLCVTLVMTVVVAAIITGLATAFLWRFSIEQEAQTLQREMNIVRDAVESIGGRLNEDSHRWKLLFTTRLMHGTIIGVAYNSTLNRYLDGMGTTQQLLSSQLEEEWQLLVQDEVTRGGQDAIDWLIALNTSSVPFVNSLNQPTTTRNIALGQWADMGHTSITVLTSHNTSGRCVDLTDWMCGLLAAHPYLLRRALEAPTKNVTAVDLALTSPAGYAAAYGRLAEGTALVYALSIAALRAKFVEQQQQAIESAAASLSSSLQLLLSNVGSDGSLQVTGPSVPVCPGWQTWLPLMLALNQTGQFKTTDPCGSEDVLVAYGPVTSFGLGLVVYRNASIARVAVAQALAETFEQLNQDSTREEKLFLVMPNFPNAGCIRCLTQSMCVDECIDDAGNVTASGLALQATLQQQQGILTGYSQGELYIAGHDSLPELGLHFGIAIAEAHVQLDGLRLAMAYVDKQNALTNTSQEILLARAKAGVDQQDINDAEDFDFLTKLRFASQCRQLCGMGKNVATPMVKALRGESGIVIAADYRPIPVIAAYTYLEDLQVGLVVKVDASEAEHPSVTVASRLALICVEVACCCLVALAFIIKGIVAWIEKTWAEGQRVAREQRQQLLTFLDRMYPASVARDLILTRPKFGGVMSFMVAVPHASVVFSDIRGFTSTCNRLTAQQLLTFLGYIFSVMDVVAARAGMCRVKVIGDSYMAVAGLPGSSDSPCRSAIFFASWCAQIFSNRYSHPLQSPGTLASLASLATDKDPSPEPWRGDSAAAGNEIELMEAKYFPWWNPQAMTMGKNATPCVMRYGIATGHVMAGILPGSTPILDLWGKTVTLANQMERSSQPGRILVCPHTYKSVVGDDVASYAFTFEDGPSLSARSSSSTASCHFVRCARGLPHYLAAELGLSPSEHSSGSPPDTASQCPGPLGTCDSLAECLLASSASVPCGPP